jgi:hypothetical protein
MYALWLVALMCCGRPSTASQKPSKAQLRRAKLAKEEARQPRAAAPAHSVHFSPQP